MRPKTLLEMAGVGATPSPLAVAAVVVIDAQREYVDGKLPLVGIAPALAEIARLLARARKTGVPLFISSIAAGREVLSARIRPVTRSLGMPPRPQVKR